MNFSVEGPQLVGPETAEPPRPQPEVKKTVEAETAELPEAVLKAIRVELRNTLDPFQEPLVADAVYAALKESKLLYRYGLLNAESKTQEQLDRNAKGEKLVMEAIEKERQAMIERKRGKKSVN